MVAVVLLVLNAVFILLGLFGVAIPAIERQGYSVDECTYMLGIGRTKVFDLIKEGRIRIVKIGVRTIIPKSEIDRLLNGDDDRAA